VRNTASTERRLKQSALIALTGIHLAWAAEAAQAGEPAVHASPAAISQRDHPTWISARDTLQSLLPALLQQLKVPGVAVVLVQDGRTVWSAEYGLREQGDPQSSVSADTVFEAASMSKPVFAYLVMQQVQAGRLDLDIPLDRYLQAPPEQFEAPTGWQERITARMLLDHTAGLPNWRASGDEHRGSLAMLSEPGQTFHYSGEGYFYLQRVLEQLSGEPLEALAAHSLFEPLGMAHTSFVMTPALAALRARGHDEAGRPLPYSSYPQANAAYSLQTTASDYARFIAELLKPERSAAHLLNAALLQEMLSHQVRATGREPIVRPGAARSDPAQPVFWGLGWGINTSSQGDIVYHSGSNSSGFRCYSQFSPSRRSALVLMSNGLAGNLLWQRVAAAIGDL
jgi:CubicO group peptidase (beta-lactamase class C family)